MGMRIIGSASSSTFFAGGTLRVGSIGAGAELRGATGTATGTASSSTGFAGGALGVGSTGVATELRSATGTASSSAGFTGGALGVGSTGAGVVMCGTTGGATGAATGAEGSGGAVGTGWLADSGSGDVGGRDALAHAGGETGVGRPTDPENTGVRCRADGGDDATVGEVPAGTAEGGRI